MQRLALEPGYEISRVIRGGWQLSQSHSQNTSDDPRRHDRLRRRWHHHRADIYTGVEELIGRFRQEYLRLRGAEALARIRVHTKFVPDMNSLRSIDKAYVQGVIDTSLRRLGLEQLDTVQFHWVDYAADRWLQTAGGGRKSFAAPARSTGWAARISTPPTSP